MNDTESTEPKESNKYPGHLTSRKVARIVGWVITGLALACFFALLFGLLVKWLWAATLTPLFHLPQPTYWQAVGLIILARLLFGGFDHHRKAASHARNNKWHDRLHGHS
jgi:hypothetical protein